MITKGRYKMGGGLEGKQCRKKCVRSGSVHHGLHVDFGVVSRNSVVRWWSGDGRTVAAAVVTRSSSTLSSSDDEEHEFLVVPGDPCWPSVAVMLLDSSEDENDDKRLGAAGGAFNRCTHTSKCSIIRRPDWCRWSSVHCSAKRSWTCSMHCRYPARYKSVRDGGTAAFRFRYLTVISRMSAFSSLFTLDKSCPAYSKQYTNEYVYLVPVQNHVDSG